MFTFENPSHRQRLTELGILSPNEAEISSADLAQRLIASRYFEEALYIIKQDFAHPLMTYGMVESQVDMLEQEISLITTVAEYTQAAINLKKLASLSANMQFWAEDMQNLVDEIKIGVSQHPNEQLSTPQAEKYLKDIATFGQQLERLVAQKQAFIETQVQKLGYQLRQKNTF